MRGLVVVENIKKKKKSRQLHIVYHKTVMIVSETILLYHIIKMSLHLIRLVFMDFFLDTDTDTYCRLMECYYKKIII